MSSRETYILKYLYMKFHVTGNLLQENPRGVGEADSVWMKENWS